MDLSGYRGDVSFAQLLDWHLTRGTRPNGSADPAKLGRQWGDAEFADCVGVGSRDNAGRRSVQAWRRGDNVPLHLAKLEKVLFGEGEEAFAVWRADLRAAHRQAKRRSTVSATVAVATTTVVTTNGTESAGAQFGALYVETKEIDEIIDKFTERVIQRLVAVLDNNKKLAARLEHSENMRRKIAVLGRRYAANLGAYDEAFTKLELENSEEFIIEVLPGEFSHKNFDEIIQAVRTHKSFK